MASFAWGNMASRAACLAVGVWLAVLLSDGLRPTVQWLPESKPRPIRVSVRAITAPSSAAQPPKAAPREVLPIKVDKAPPKLPKLPKQPKPITAKEVSAAIPVTLPVTIPEIVSQQPLPTLSQPALGMPTPQEIPQLPPIPGAELPPAPPENAAANSYPEKPGGSVLVLELIVNDQGIVIDSRILVPSSNGLADFTLVMSVKGQRWKELTPPLYPGEKRRLEIRVPFADENAKNPADALP